MLRKVNSSLCDDIIDEFSHDSMLLPWQDDGVEDECPGEIAMSHDPSIPICSLGFAASGVSKDLAFSIWRGSWGDSSSDSESDGGQVLGVIIGVGGFSGSSWQRIPSL